MVIDNDTWDVIEKLLPYNLTELQQAVYKVKETGIKYEFLVIPFGSILDDINTRIMMNFKWLMNEYWIVLYSNSDKTWIETLNEDLKSLNETQREELNKNKLFNYMRIEYWLWQE